MASPLVAREALLARGRKPAQSVAPTTPTARRVELWRKAKVMEFTGVSMSTIERMIARGEFPRSRTISKRVVVWLASEIETWALKLPVV